jgi:hypothetical protein
MTALITGALFLIILAAFAGWFFGTWQTRLRKKPNLDQKWNEGPFYYRYWNPWNQHKHYLFTPKELATPVRRAQINPEDARIPF